MSRWEDIHDELATLERLVFGAIEDKQHVDRSRCRAAEHRLIDAVNNAKLATYPSGPMATPNGGIRAKAAWRDARIRLDRHGGCIDPELKDAVERVRVLFR